MIVNLFLAFQTKTFFEAYQILKRQTTESALPRYFVPIIVNGALSAEFALKSILAENHVDYKKEHNLLSLFILLPTDFALEVVNRSMAIAPSYQKFNKWTDELILISEAFVDWRYYFESGAPAFDIAFFDSFVCAVCETLISHYNVELVETVDHEKTDAEIDDMIAENRLRSREAVLEKLSRKRK